MSNVSGKEQIYGFIDSVLDRLSQSDCPAVINLSRAFRDYLELQPRTSFRADELVEKWHPQLLELLESRFLRDFNSLGVPRPAALHEDGMTLLTWKHPNFEQLSGLDSIGNRFFEICTWLSTLSSSDFLIACAALLAILGADPIFVTDTSGDGGADCIGIIPEGPLRSICLFVQAKTSVGSISRDTILAEYGKYMLLPHLERYQIYREKLGVNRRADGASQIYMMVSNNEFRRRSREAAVQLGVILRSGIQLAHLLSMHADTHVLNECLEELREFAQRETLYTNLAPRIRSILDASDSGSSA